MPGLPDPLHSRAVLIGAAKYQALNPLPAVANNVSALARALRAEHVWGLPEAHCVVVKNPQTAADLLDPVVDIAQQVTDTLIFYYAGHGLVDPRRSDLHLAVSKSDPRRMYTAVPYAYVRDAILDCRASRRIVLLDCCYSGRALGQMADSVAAIVNEVSAEGTYVLAAAAENKAALAPPGAQFTAFTGELLNIMNHGIPEKGKFLDLDSIYTQLLAELNAKGFPIPQKRDRNTAGQLALIKNKAFVNRPANAESHGSSGSPTKTTAQHVTVSHVSSPSRATPTRISAVDGLAHIGGIAFSPDGRTLAIRTYASGVGGNNGKVILYDVANPAQPRRTAIIAHRSNSLYAMAFSPDGHTLATSARDPRALGRAMTGEQHRRFQYELIMWDIFDPARPSRIWALDGMVGSVAFSPDGRIMVTAGSSTTAISPEMALWDLNKPVRSLLRKHPAPTRISVVGGIRSVGAFSPDGRTLATPTGENVILWDVADPQQPIRLSTLSRKFVHVGTVVFSPDGRILASADDGRVILWDIADMAFLSPVTTGDQPVQPSPNVITELSGLAYQERAVMFSPDGRTLATAAGGTKGSTFHLGDIILWDVTQPTQPVRITALTGLYTPHTMAFSPDGQTLATAGGNPGLVILWNLGKP